MMPDLPPELWSKILAHLRIAEILQCQLVCKNFYLLTHSVPECRLRIELASAGYAEPLHPRMDISTIQATGMLRTHLSRAVSQVDDLSDFMTAGFDVGRRNGRSLSEPEIRPMFFGGVLARWSSVQSDSYLPLQMDAVRLPSSNRGTELERWKVIEPKLDVQGYWMEPKYDLLVLLVYSQNKKKQIHYCNFYLRTLSSNAPHPQVRSEVLTHTLPRMHEPLWRSAVQIVGRLLIVRSTSGPRSLVVWDWITGRQHLDRVITPGYGQGIGTLTSDTIVVPRCMFRYETKNQPMAYLDVFSLKIIPLKKWTIDPPPPNPDNDSDWTIDIDRIATFELPRIRSVTEIPLYASSWTHPGDLAISCVCSIDPSFSPSPLPDSPAYSPMLSEASKYHPASVFEVSNSGRVLRFALDLPFRYGSGEIDLDACSWLLVPVYVFSYFIQRVKLETPLVEPADTPTFAWDEWGHLARWIHNHKLSDFSWTVVTSGTRSLLMHESVDCSGAGSCNLCGGSPVTPDSPKIWILDFNRRKLQQLEPQNRARTPATTYAGVYQPALADAYTPDVEWLHNARDAIAPYIKTPFWHEFIRKFTGGDSLEVWIDDEHVVLLDQNASRLGAITF